MFLGRFVWCFWGDSLLIFEIFTWKLFQRDGIGCIAFLLIYHVGINLSGCHVFMRKHLTDGIDVSAVGYQQCSVSVAETVNTGSCLTANDN